MDRICWKSRWVGSAGSRNPGGREWGVGRDTTGLGVLPWKVGLQGNGELSHVSLGW